MFRFHPIHCGIISVHKVKGAKAMLFYQFTGKLKDENEFVNDMASRQQKRSKANFIQNKAEQYWESAKDGSCFFVVDIADGKALCAAVSYKKLDIKRNAAEFFAAIEIDAEFETGDEITCRKLFDLLNTAERECFMNRRADVLERFRIDSIDDLSRRALPFREDFFKTVEDEKELYDRAKIMLCGETLIPELDRILTAEKSVKQYGHPVHYIIESDDEAAADGMLDTLLPALYARDRIISRRYIDFGREYNSRTFAEVIDAAFESCGGGTVVISLIDELTETGDHLEAFGEQNFDTLCRQAAMFGSKVLFVFRLPRECTAIKKRIAELLGGMTFIEIKEDNVESDKARSALEAMAAESELKSDELLLDRIQDGKTYFGSELRKIFADWYAIKLKTEIYPQYSGFSQCRAEVIRAEDKGGAYDELSSMIGLSAAKSVIEKALNFYKLQRLYKDRGIDQTRPAMHMVFTGNPGTAKTTVARLFARIMRENELLSRGHLVEVGRNDLVGKYVGWTAKVVEDKFRQADGGVLFIDEAYSLVDDRDGLYGDEAINTIVQQMENRRDSMVVIFAGYPDKMEGFLNKNPGLRSRIAFHVPFSDYSVNELMDITAHIANGKGLRISSGAMDKLASIYKNALVSKDFGNGRFVRSLIEKTEMNMAGRLLALDPERITADELTIITSDDVDLPEERQEKTERRIGF